MVRNRHEVFACGTCLAFLGTLEEQLDLLTGESTPATVGTEVASWKLPWQLPEEASRGQDEKQAMRSRPEKCRCGESFCSVDCLLGSVHKHLCVAELPEEGAEETPLFQFKVHALQNNELYMLGAKTLAKLAKRLEEDDGANVLVPLSGMVGEPWWEFVVPTEKEEAIADGDLASYRSRVKEEAVESLRLLRQALTGTSCVGPGVAALEKAGVLSVDFWGRLLGSFQTNNFGIVVDSPLKRYMHAVAKESLRKEPHKDVGASVDVLEKCGAQIVKRDEPEGEQACDTDCGPSLRDMLGDESTFAPPVDGIAVFPLMALVNHSCDPNAKVRFQCGADGARAELVALRPILRGEEVFHSYIDKNLPSGVRGKKLTDIYGFKCRCSRCSVGPASGLGNRPKRSRLK